MTVVVGDQRRQVGTGGFVWLPRDVPHTFRVDTDTVHQLELVTPAGFERFHVDTSDPATTPSLPAPAEPDIPRLLDAIGRYDAEIVGPPIRRRPVKTASAAAQRAVGELAVFHHSGAGRRSG